MLERAGDPVAAGEAYLRAARMTASGIGRRDRQARMDQEDSPDNIEPALAPDATENAEAIDPAEPIDRMEPADPIDRMEPAEPIDRIEPDEPMLKMEPADPVQPRVSRLVRMIAFSPAPVALRDEYGQVRGVCMRGNEVQGTRQTRGDQMAVLAKMTVVPLRSGKR